MPGLICHCNISSERWVLIVGEDVWEDGLEVTSLVISHYLLAGQRDHYFLFEMATRPIFRFTVKRICLFVHACSMYITLTGIQNGEPVYLASVPGNACRGLEIAHCELTYYHRWLNIGATLENNQVSTGHTTLKIPDGYYNVCELDDVFQPQGTEIWRWLVGDVGRETSGHKSPASRPPWVFLRHLRAWQVTSHTGLLSTGRSAYT